MFVLILPLCGLDLLAVIAFIPDTRQQKRFRLDWTGFLALSVAVTCLQLLLDRSERLDWFDNSVMLMVAAVLVVSFYILSSTR